MICVCAPLFLRLREEMNSLVAIEHIEWLATTIMMIFLLPQNLKFYLNLILIIFCDIFKTPLHLKNSTKKKKLCK